MLDTRAIQGQGPVSRAILLSTLAFILLGLAPAAQAKWKLIIVREVVKPPNVVVGKAATLAVEVPDEAFKVPMEKLGRSPAEWECEIDAKTTEINSTDPLVVAESRLLECHAGRALRVHLDGVVDTVSQCCLASDDKARFVELHTALNAVPQISAGTVATTFFADGDTMGMPGKLTVTDGTPGGMPEAGVPKEHVVRWTMFLDWIANTPPGPKLSP